MMAPLLSLHPLDCALGFRTTSTRTQKEEYNGDHMVSAVKGASYRINLSAAADVGWNEHKHYKIPTSAASA